MRKRSSRASDPAVPALIETLRAMHVVEKPAARALRPFFSYYGGKWLAAPRYPVPDHNVIIEPFAGAAGYATRYADRNVILIDKSDYVIGVWRYLIKTPAREIELLPDLPDGATTDDLQVCQEARWLIGFWANQAAAAPGKRKSAWAKGLRKKHFWGAHIKTRLASQVERVRHWQVIHGSYQDAPDIEATWFIDPPYQVGGQHYPHGCDALDFHALGAWCRSRRGQAIVCEGERASWLPFRQFRTNRSAHKKSSGSREVIWTSNKMAPASVSCDTISP